MFHIYEKVGVTALSFFFSLCRLQSNSFIFFPLIPQVRPGGRHNPCQTTSGHLERKEWSSDVGGGVVKIQKPALSYRQHWVSQDPRTVLVGFTSLGIGDMILQGSVSLGNTDICYPYFPFQKQIKQKQRNSAVNFSMKIIQNWCISHVN